ncbi:MAG: hypothetical protein QM709_01690 [Spongiibacteraceae bacterium]
MRNIQLPRLLPLISIGALLIASAAYAESNLADPTRPSGYSENASARANPSEKLTLTLIRLGTEPQAVINGKTVTPGELIAGHRLLSLQATSAVLSGPNGRTVLHLAPAIRKPSSTYSVQNR